MLLLELETKGFTIGCILLQFAHFTGEDGYVTSVPSYHWHSVSNSFKLLLFRNTRLGIPWIVQFLKN